MKKFIEIFGWYGAFAILLAYVLISFSIVEPESLCYQLLNVSGGAGLTAVALYKKDYQLVVVNLVWAVIGAIVILRLIL